MCLLEKMELEKLHFLLVLAESATATHISWDFHHLETIRLMYSLERFATRQTGIL